MPLADYEEALESKVVVDEYGKAKFDDLPDGDYKFEITLLKIKDENDLIAFELIILNDGDLNGVKTERCYWMSKKDDSGGKVFNARSKSELDRDLKTLGFDPANWTKANGRPWIAELKKAVKVAKGLGILATKISKAGERGVFHNLKIVKRLDDGRPASFSAEDLVKANADPFGDPPAGDDDDKIPD